MPSVVSQTPPILAGEAGYSVQLIDGAQIIITAVNVTLDAGNVSGALDITVYADSLTLGAIPPLPGRNVYIHVRQLTSVGGIIDVSGKNGTGYLPGTKNDGLNFGEDGESPDLLPIPLRGGSGGPGGSIRIFANELLGDLVLKADGGDGGRGKDGGDGFRGQPGINGVSNPGPQDGSPGGKGGRAGLGGIGGDGGDAGVIELQVAKPFTSQISVSARGGSAGARGSNGKPGPGGPGGKNDIPIFYGPGHGHQQ